VRMNNYLRFMLVSGARMDSLTGSNEALGATTKGWSMSMVSPTTKGSRSMVSKV